jgi:dihydroneopterin aldolase
LRPSNNLMPFHSLYLEELSLRIKLGCTKEERTNPQEVRVSVELYFETAPAALTSDSLQDTICYAEICKALKYHLETHEYQLLERLAFEGYGVVREIVRGRAKISFSAHKVHPPVKGLLGGAVYRCGEMVG